jgi:lipopolysaccharide/colanic/teichoic acid biosynthesis glycosyltransferase
LPRSFDVIVSLVGLTVSLPLLLAGGAMVALSSRGAVLFRQKRVGHNGELFTLYKLRTMRGLDNGLQVTSGNNPRITPAGKFLRRTKLDELPTLWNVLRGDMSFVGPRPEVPRYVNLDDPLWQMILAVRPGITDPVTLSLRREEELLARVANDKEGDAEKYYVNVLQPQKLKGYVAYRKERSWKSDLRVLLQTIGAVIVPLDT